MTVTICKEVTTTYNLPNGQKMTKTIKECKEVPIEDPDKAKNDGRGRW